LNKYRSAVLSTEDRQLLLSSRTIESYPDLIPVLEKHTKVKEIDELINISEDVKNIFKFSIKSIIADASKEWVQTGKVFDRQNLETKCSLCGTRTRYICYIQNIYTGKRLNVGTDCIEKFPDITSSNVKLEKQELIKLEKNNRRRIQLGISFPNLQNDISEVEILLKSSPVILPDSLENDLNFYISKLRKLSNSYITTSKNSVLKNIEEIYNRLLLRKKTMINFIELNRHNPFICSNIIKHWIESNYKKSNILNIIRREKGFITNTTIRYIWESGFVSSHEAELKNSLNNTSLILVVC